MEAGPFPEGRSCLVVKYAPWRELTMFEYVLDEEITGEQAEEVLQKTRERYPEATLQITYSIHTNDFEAWRLVEFLVSQMTEE